METIELGKKFSFRDLIDYEKGKAVKKPVLEGTAPTKIVMVACDEVGLPEHSAPENALLTVIDGEGELNYEGQNIKLHHGVSFAMAKGAKHSVEVTKKLKFMLLFY